MRKKRWAFDRGSSLGSDESEVVTSGASLVELGFAASGLFGVEDAIPNFLGSVLLRRCNFGNKTTKTQRHKEKPHQNIFSRGFSLCLCVFVVFNVRHSICSEPPISTVS